MKNKFNRWQKKYCNLENEYEVAFVVKVGWKYHGIKQQEATLLILDGTTSFEDIYYLEHLSTYRDPAGDVIAIIHESMYYFQVSLDDCEWYIKLDENLTHQYRGKLWFNVKKEIYEDDSIYNWFDKEDFLNNFNDPNYIMEESKPLIHVFTSALNDYS